MYFVFKYLPQAVVFQYLYLNTFSLDVMLFIFKYILGNVFCNYNKKGFERIWPNSAGFLVAAWRLFLSKFLSLIVTSNTDNWRCSCNADELFDVQCQVGLSPVIQWRCGLADWVLGLEHERSQVQAQSIATVVRITSHN